MARPKKGNQEKLTVRLATRCTKAELDILKGKAKEAKASSVSAYIRQIALNGNIKIIEMAGEGTQSRENITDGDDVFSLIDQVRRIGININQIAKRMNTSDEIPHVAYFTEMRNSFLRLEDKIIEYFDRTLDS